MLMNGGSIGYISIPTSGNQQEMMKLNAFEQQLKTKWRLREKEGSLLCLLCFVCVILSGWDKVSVGMKVGW